MLSCEQNSLVAQFYAGNNKDKQKDALWFFWCVCAHACTRIIIRPVQMGKNSFLQTFCNSTKLDVLLQFWNSWQDEIVLTFLSKEGPSNSQGGCRIHFSLLLFMDLVPWPELFLETKYTMSTIWDTILLSHLIWEKASQV